MNRYIELESYIQQYCFDRMNVKWEYIDKPKLKIEWCRMRSIKMRNHSEQSWSEYKRN